MARSTLEDFVIKGKLGSGSFGCVHKVVRKVDRACYALKEVDLSGMSRKEQEECIKETQIMSLLESDFIIRYYDSFLEKGKLWICMEYAPGGNLYDFIKRQKSSLPEELVWRLALQMLLGLHHMHSRKMLHRDFKTLNVFLDDRLNVKLGDLGVARVLGTNTAFARTIVGTPYYLSPEMCEDKPYNDKSDVWALGVVLYECCTQKHPFDADNQGALILKILKGQYPAVSGYSRELTDVIRAALTLDARRRPDTSALLVSKAMRDWAAKLGLEEQLPPAPPAAASAAVLSLAPHLAAAAGAAGAAALPASGSAAALRKPSPRAAGPASAAAAGQAGISKSSSVQRRSSKSDLIAASPRDRPGSAAAGQQPAVAVSPHDMAGGSAVGAPAGASSGGKLFVAGSRPPSASKSPGRSPPSSSSRTQALGSPAGGAAAAAAAGTSAALQELSLGEAGSAPDDDAAAGANLSGAMEQPGSRCNSTTAPAAVSGLAQPPESDRWSLVREASDKLRQGIIDLVGGRSFEALQMLFNMADQQAAESGDDALQLAMQKVIPAGKVAAVLPLMVKLSCLEAQLQGY